LKFTSCLKSENFKFSLYRYIEALEQLHGNPVAPRAGHTATLLPGWDSARWNQVDP
jgi:hypothetical protein